MCFFFNDTATTEIYTLSLHDALPISKARALGAYLHDARNHRSQAPTTPRGQRGRRRQAVCLGRYGDRKSTRLNSSHANISYAVFCLKKKKNNVKKTTEAQTITRNVRI